MRRFAPRAWLVVATLVAGLLPTATALADEPIPTVVYGAWFATDQPMQEHHVITFQASIQAPSDGWATDATVTFEPLVGDDPALKCTIAVNPENGTLCELPSMPAGSYQYKVTYSGNAAFAGSVSPEFDFTIDPDVLDASGVGVSNSIFYPYKDGYLDTVSIRGTRNESIAVVIRIYRPTGALLRTISIAKGTGAYSFAWNGRSSSGAMLSSGKYKVVQTLTDEGPVVKAFTSYATISAKKLVIKTTYVTKKGSAISARGTDGNGSISTSTSGGYTKLVGRYPTGSTVVGYQFTLPAAVVYKSIAFQVSTKGALRIPPNEIGLQNFKTCAYASGAWDIGCFDHWKGFPSSGSSSLSWTTTSGSATNNRQSRTARGAVSVINGTMYIYTARIKITYGVLQ
jgi:FlgD Ig-like domain